MAIIGIDYDGYTTEYDDDDNEIMLDPSDPRYLKYESVHISYEGGKKVFDSGDFVKDWFNAKKFYIQELQDTEAHFMGSSSCDHFHKDGANFDSAYFNMEGDEPVLKYIDKSDKDWVVTQWHIVQNGWEFFVNPGTKPTWQELKDYCND